MKRAVNYWSFPGGVEGRLPLAEAARQAAELGFAGLEVCLFGEGPLAIDISDGDLVQARRDLDAAGVQATSVVTELLWSYPLSAADPALREHGKWLIKRLLHAAHALGASAVLVVPGLVENCFQPEMEIIPYEVALARVEEAVRELVPEAERQQVAMGLENVWGKLLLSPLEARDFVDGFGSESVGWFMDVGNILLTGFPEQWIRILGKRIRKVHAKDFRRSIGTLEGFVDLLEGDVNWPAVMQALREVGYDDYLIAEMVPQYQHASEVRAANAARALEAILAM